MPARCPILLVGQTGGPELSAAAAPLLRAADVQQAPDLAAALDRRVERGFSPPGPPVVIVVAQRWPGDFTPADIDRLRRRYPLARIESLLSSLCEGEGRTGAPWPGVPRVMWHQFWPRFAVALERWQAGQDREWSWPATMSGEERLMLARFPQSAGTGHEVDLALMAAEDRDERSLLAAACKSAGLTAVAFAPSAGWPEVEGSVALVWSGSIRRPNAEAEIVRAVERYRPPNSVAVLDFPRRDEVERLHAAGVTHVAARPLALAELMTLVVGFAPAPLPRELDRHAAA